MGVIGAVVGTIFSYVISYAIFSVTFRIINDVATSGGYAIADFQIILLPKTLIATFLIGIGSCIFASLYPSWKASRQPIIECLNPIAQKTVREKKHILKQILFFVLCILVIGLSIWILNWPTPSTLSFEQTHPLRKDVGI